MPARFRRLPVMTREDSSIHRWIGRLCRISPYEAQEPRKEKEMKYALLIYPGPALEAIGQLSEEEQKAVMSEYRALGQEPDIFFSEQLQAADKVVTVRVEAGRTLTSEGGLADQDMAGLYLLEADGMDRALELAARFPAARLGGAVEVRPIVER
jgi:hypothetical protein